MVEEENLVVNPAEGVAVEEEVAPGVVEEGAGEGVVPETPAE